MARADSLRGIEHEMGVLIRRIKRVIGDRAREVHPDLQRASYLMLSYLSQHGPLRPSELVEIFDVDKAAVSRQLQHLVDLGLVDRVRDPADGRASLVSASPAATARLQEVSESRREWLADRLGDWSAEELDTLAVSLARYNAALEAQPTRSPQPTA